MAKRTGAPHLCSFGGGSLRSWTDVFTNHTFIGPLHPVLGVEDILNGRIPPFALPHFLHEATHHTCLGSPVGLGLAVLEQQARDLAESGSRKDLSAARMYHLRVEMLLAMYRPLFEGVALFAEFDASPGASRVTTLPMILAVDMFLRETAAGKSAEAIFGQLFGLL